ncbi:N-acyl homoserine lactonase family protein [Winogradskyella jejuensis]|uniref:Metallo-beta-lactamase superfamily protein n=1 Tax=Winogradskyella jejuensis TaxID=1089305 RepID=A0A1M5NBY1_9FLAO|nr:N-acyl homoserine lactonase family protein [Winogradskyella jejuensis]SHG86689.1 Metallo-beta-lactamase superfamily protein [Winogradskyella jejuensis]
MKRVLTILSLAVLLSACKDFKEGYKDGYNQAKEEAEANNEIETEADTKSKVKLYALDGGTVKVNMLELFSQDTTYTGQTKTFADAFYIIEHPKGRLLWDAGLGEGLVGQEPFTTPDGAFTVSRKDSVVSQLAQLNLTPRDFDFIAVSHTHFDHTGSASKFADAIWLVQETEYDFITSEEQKKGDNYKAIAALTKVEKLKGDFDVFGDGTVVIKSMPGHTPGHQVLFLKLENAGNILLTGDLYHFQENRDSKGVPSFNYDVDMTLKSMEAFENFAKENNADVYIQHSTDDFNRLPKYPKYLD